MKIQRREFLKRAAALAAVSNLRVSRVVAVTAPKSYPYLGRTEDYAECA